MKPITLYKIIGGRDSIYFNPSLKPEFNLSSIS